MNRTTRKQWIVALLMMSAVGASGCRSGMPHSLTWPATGDIVQTHPKPPEGGYYTDWDPYAKTLEVEPMEDVNPVQTQHILVATVLDENGNPLPNRRVEWMIAEGSVGGIVEVDESGWRASRGYKVNNSYAVSHTNNFDHVLTRGNDDPSDDIHLKAGQTWCVITSPVEGDTHVMVYAPGIYNWDRHKVFAVKHWYDVTWEFPAEATNPIGTSHEFLTQVTRYSDGAPLAGYTVSYSVLDGPGAMFESSGGPVATVQTDDQGYARVMLRQSSPVEGTNNIEIDIMRPANESCCEPAVHIATGHTSKTWIGPKIAITKTAPPREIVDNPFSYSIVVSNPSDVAATNVVVSDTLPQGITYASSSPSAQAQGQSLSWSIGTLPARSERSITVQVSGSRTGTFENCASVSADHGLADRSCATTVITAPSLVVQKECTPEVTVCDPIEYRVVVRNTGDAPAANIRLNDRLPAGLETTDGKRVVTSNIGTLEAGQAREVRYTVRASDTGTYENTVSVTGDGGISEEAMCRTVVRQPVLEVTKSGPDVRYVGRPVTYEITVTNTGDTVAANTMLVDTLPAGTQFVRASDGGQFANGQVTWSVGSLAAGASRTVTLDLRATQAVTARNTVSARAVCAEDDAVVSTTIRGVPAILLEVIDVEDPIEVGANITYVITVTNQGSAEGTGIKIECVLPAELDYVDGQGPTTARVDGKNVIFAPLPSLAPKAKATYRVTARGNAEIDARFGVTLTSDQVTRPVEETESTNIYE